MAEQNEGKRLVLPLSGHIDSANASGTEAELMKERENVPHEGLTLDLDKLDYISSAGLRVILRLRKLEPELKLVNVSSEVYEVFSMTGFTEMMPVEKAMRKLSVEGCEAIGRGANGTVYRIDKDTVVKVYHNSDSLPDVQRERELARKAFVLGIPTAIPYDVVKVGDSYGSVFELLNSSSFSRLIREHPEKLEEYVRTYVDIMLKLHSTEVKPGELPEMKNIALGWEDYLRGELPDEYLDKLLRLIREIPDRYTLLHGDYHTNNIVVQEDEVLIIDMDTLCTGHPIFELAFMWLAFVGFGELEERMSSDFFKLSGAMTGELWRTALRLYLGSADEAYLASVEEKAMTIGYARLMRRTLKRGGMDNDFGRATIEHCRQRLFELLDKLDSLFF